MNASVPKVRVSYERAKGETIVVGLTAFQFDASGVAVVDWLGSAGTDAESLVRRHGCYGASVAFDAVQAEMPASAPSVTGPVAAEILPGPESTTLSPDVHATLHPAFQVVMEDAGDEETFTSAPPVVEAVSDEVVAAEPVAPVVEESPAQPTSPYASLVTSSPSPSSKKRRHS